MIRVTPTITVGVGSVDYTVCADCTVTPGESRSWDNPGTDPTIECDGCTVIECEFEDEDGYAYLDRTGLGNHTGRIDRILLAELRSGTHDDELFDNIDYVGDLDYDE